jgi:protection of telomeres protein 1
MALPPGFTAIQDAKASLSINLLGVIVSFKEPRKTKGTDWVLDFTIQDDFTLGLVGSSGSINCRLFRPERSIPAMAVGDIALLRSWKITEWGLKLDCLSDFKSSCGLLVFPAKSIPHPDLSSPYKVGSLTLPSISGWMTKAATTSEQLAVIRLKHAASDHRQQIQQHATVNTFQASRPARDKRALVQDMVDSLFYDVCAQVVNTYYTGYGTVDLKITDFTENEGLFYYADPEGEDAYLAHTRGFTGPYGKRTMSVTLYENNAAWARENISQGDYIFLRNLRTKISPANVLEGVLHADRQRPDQVDVRKLTLQKDIEAIKERQRAYDQGRGKQSAFEAIQSYVEPAPTSKKAELSKKAKKRQQQREAKEAELKELEENEKNWEVERSGVNPNSKLR